MAIRFYDTGKRDWVDFAPLEPGRVGFYICGPTVYNLIHIGNARTFVAFDVVVRHLRGRGFEVRYVRNITDVDDRIIQRANEIGEQPSTLADRYVAEFQRDVGELGLLTPDVEPRVTTHMSGIVSLIERLVARELAYPIDGDVYYATRRFPTYGRLSGRDLDELRAGARVEVDERKRDPLDFALWKAAKPGEPFWPSPFGPGRPGWHIECSAMSMQHLGERFDIHAGGMDLIFPHHENEIAQSQGALGEGSFAHHWLHSGFLNLNDEKMSKSIGNIFSLRDMLGWHDAEALRLYLLGTHFRHPMNFEVAPDTARPDRPAFPGINEAESRSDYYYETLLRLEERLPGAGGDGSAEAVLSALDDDFNSAAALAVLNEKFVNANRTLDAGSRDRAALAGTLGELRACGRILGLLQSNPVERQRRRRDVRAQQHGIDAAAVEARIVARTTARKSRDFARADQIRDELLAMGIELRDGAAGTTWTIRS